MNKKIFYHFLTLLLFVILIYNFTLYVRKKRNIRNEYLRKFKPLIIPDSLSYFKKKINIYNKNISMKKNYKFIFIFELEDCDLCIYNMFKIIDKLQYYEKIKFEIYIAASDYDIAKSYCDQYFSDYFDVIDFYFIDYSRLSKAKVNYTPVLSVFSRNNKQILNYWITADINSLWILLTFLNIINK